MVEEAKHFGNPFIVLDWSDSFVIYCKQWIKLWKQMVLVNVLLPTSGGKETLHAHTQTHTKFGIVHLELICRCEL